MHSRSPNSPALRRFVCLALAALALSGCIIAPYPYHPFYPRYGYYR